MLCLLTHCKKINARILKNTFSLLNCSYRWAFIGDPGASVKEVEKRRLKDQIPSFVPHVIRIARLMNARVSTSITTSNVLDYLVIELD